MKICFKPYINIEIMKTLRYYIMMAAVLLLAGCSSDNDIADAGQAARPGALVRIMVGINDTRVSYDDANDIMPFAWEDGDCIVAVGTDNAGTYKGTSEFKMSQMENGTAEFAGTLIEGAEKYVLYYQSAKLTIDENGSAAIDYSTQTEDAANPTAHVRDYMMMASEVIPAADMENNEVRKSLSLKNSMVRMDVRSFPSAVGALKEIVLMTNTQTTEEGSVKIAISNPASAFKVFMMFNPETTAQKAGNTFKVLFKGDADYRVKKENSKAMLDKGGMRYNLIIFQDEQLEEGRKGLNNWMESMGNIEIDAADNCIYTLKPGSITAEVLARAMGNGTKVKVAGEINGADIKVLREAAGCVSENNGSNTATLTMLDLSGAVIKQSTDVYCHDMNGNYSTEDNVIGDHMFMNSKLQSIVLPENITAINKNAFFNCKALTTINIPSTVTNIGEEAFAGMAIEDITVPQGVVTYGKNIFKDCISLLTVTLNCNKISEGMFQACNNPSLTVEIGPSVTEIESDAFKNAGITTLDIPATVTTLHDRFLADTQVISLKIRGNFDYDTMNAAFTGFNNSANCDLLIVNERLNQVTTDTEGRPMLAGLVWKSVKDLDGNSQVN